MGYLFAGNLLQSCPRLRLTGFIQTRQDVFRKCCASLNILRSIEDEHNFVNTVTQYYPVETSSKPLLPRSFVRSFVSSPKIIFLKRVGYIIQKKIFVPFPATFCFAELISFPFFGPETELRKNGQWPCPC